MFTIYDVSQGKYIEVDLEEGATVLQLKEKLAAQLKKPRVCLQILKNQESELTDGVKIQKEWNLEVTPWQGEYTPLEYLPLPSSDIKRVNLDQSQFKYSKKSNIDNYSVSPIGPMDLERVGQGNPKWYLGPMPATESANKTFILSDWTAEQWDFKRIQEIDRLIADLQEKRIPIYIWQNGELVLLTGTLTETHRKKMTPVTEKVLNDKAVLKGISADQSYILGMNEIQCLFEELKPEYTYIRTSHYENTSHDKQEVLEVLKQASIGYISCDNLEYSTYEQLKNVLNTKTDSLANLFKLNENNFDSSQNLTYTETTEIIPNTNTHTYAIIDDQQRFEKTTRVDLSCSTNLKNLTITAQKTFTCPFDLRDLKFFPHLETLALEQTDIPLYLIQNTILGQCRNLTRLSLAGYKNFNNTAFIEWHPPFSLSTANFSGSNLGTKSLHSFLAKNPDIKVLDLSGLELEDINDLPPLSLKNIEYLNLKDTKISPKVFHALFKNSTSIKHLNLENSTLDLEALDSCDLTSLEHLDLSKRTIYKSYSFFTHVPILKTLILDRVTFSTQYTLEFSLPSLETLSLNGKSYKVRDYLNNVIKGTLNSQGDSSLKMLSLEGCKNLRIKENFPYLESLNLQKASLFFDSMLDNLLQSQHLKNLNLSEYHVLEENSSVPTVSLETLSCENYYMVRNTVDANGISNLKELQISTSTDVSNLSYIQFPFLEKLKIKDGFFGENGKKVLYNSPRLKHLELVNFSSEDLEFNPDSLKSLETLRIEGSYIRASNLYSLLKATPNLKKLDLDLKLGVLETDSVLSAEFQKLLSKIPIVVPKELIVHKNEVKEEKKPLLPTPYYEYKSIDPKHDHKDFMDFNPKSEKEFHFKGKNKTRNQGMIIEKLSQYLIVHNKHQNWIPHLQKGICNGLAHYCADLSMQEWKAFIDTVSTWDGYEKEHEVNAYFERLIDYYLPNYQFNQDEPPTFVGDNLEEFLRSYKATKPLILENPWHSICARRVNDHWFVYDPNHIDGGRKVQETEQLLETIHHSLGTLVSVNNPWAIPLIKNPNQFIEQGGLLSLCQCSNQQEMLDQLQLEKPYTQELFDGLFIRSTSGEPAWHRAKKYPKVQKFIEPLLEEYKKLNPDTYNELLENSKKDMLNPNEKLKVSPNQKKPPIDSKQVPKKEKPNAAPNIPIQAEEKKKAPKIDSKKEEVKEIPKAQQPPTLPDYDSEFKTWDTESKEPTDLQSFIRNKLEPGKKHLIEVSSFEESQGIQAGILSYCKEQGIPLFYVHSPDDLVCAAPYIEMTDPHESKGVYKKGAKGGGPLYDFFYKESKEEKPNKPHVVLLEYDEDFNADDRIRTNTLIDPLPGIDKTTFPKDTIVIAVTSPKKSDKKDESLYSRFDTTKTCPVLQDELLQATQKPPKECKEPGNQATRINLFNGNDWKGRLLGRWIPKGKGIYFKKGELIAALGKKPIVLENAPWGNKAFQKFWQQACINRRIKTPEGEFDFNPEDFLQSDGYHWDELLDHKPLQWDNQIHPQGYALNPYQLNMLLERYICKEPILDIEPGWLELHSNKTIHLNLTRELSENEWAKCLHEAKKFQVNLKIHVAKGAPLPQCLNGKTRLQEGKAEDIQWQDKVIVTTDIDTTLNGLETDFKFPISEHNAADLLTRLQGEMNKETLEMTYSTRDHEVLKQLRLGKTVTLYGTFSLELKCALDAFVLSRQADSETKGKLILVSDEPVLPFLPTTFQKVSADEKRQILQPTDPEYKAIGGTEAFEKEALALLKTRLKYVRKHENEPMENAWKGMYKLNSGFKLKQIQDFKESANEAKAFTEKRLKEVNEVLKDEPYVYLTGLTGVGKTTFVVEHLAKHIHKDNYSEPELYRGESKIKEWALDKTKNKRKILFIDEANLSPRDWSEMESLYDIPPGIYVDGEYITLTPDHLLVCAGNPQADGGGRKLAPFFRRHGNALLFDPLPLANIYEDILQPVFKKTPLETHAETLCEPILKYYTFLCEKACERGIDKVLISARELQEMALLTSSYCSRYPDADYHKVSEFYAYEIAKSIVPAELMDDFKKFPEPRPLNRKQLPELKDSGYYITKSRQSIKNQLDDLLFLREHRMRPKATETQQFGGLGGFLLYGEPGVGKTELIAHTLRQHGYHEIKLEDFPLRGKVIPTNSFCKIPASLSRKKFLKYQLEAGNAGVVAIVDEFNSAPVPEQFMNDLLMGYVPQKTKKSKPKKELPKVSEGPSEAKELSPSPGTVQKKDSVQKRLAKPGYLLIGMGNPPTHHGRSIVTTASSRRVHNAILHPMPEDEMASILRKKGLGAFKTAGVIESFKRQRSNAVTSNLSPKPGFRNVNKLANKLKPIDFTGKIKQFNEDIDFGESRSSENKSRLIDKEIQRLIKAHPQLKRLFRSIQAMQNHGLSIKNHPKGQKMYQDAQLLKEKLTLHLNSKLSSNIEDECKAILARNDSVGTHRKAWKVILYNVAISLIGVGLIALAIRAGHHVYDSWKKDKPTSFNHFMFFGRTKSQLLAREVRNALDGSVDRIGKKDPGENPEEIKSEGPKLK